MWLFFRKLPFPFLLAFSQGPGWINGISIGKTLASSHQTHPGPPFEQIGDKPRLSLCRLKILLLTLIYLLGSRLRNLWLVNPNEDKHRRNKHQETHWWMSNSVFCSVLCVYLFILPTQWSAGITQLLTVEGFALCSFSIRPSSGWHQRQALMNVR